MPSTYVSTRSQAPATAPAAAPQPQDAEAPEALVKALRSERQRAKDAETRLNRIRSEVQAELVKFSDRLHKLEQLMQRIAQTQVDQASELREARELAALFRRGI